MTNEKNKANSFSNYIISFFIYSVVLWLYDVAASWATMPYESWSIGGFLYGPYAPFAAFCIVFAMFLFHLVGRIWKDINPTPILLVVMSFILFGVLLYLGSLAFEGIFGYLPWDYSGRILNINGRVCVERIVAMTIIEVICVYAVQPLLNRQLNKLNIALRYIIAMLLVAVILTDIVCTII